MPERSTPCRGRRFAAEMIAHTLRPHDRPAMRGKNRVEPAHPPARMSRRAPADARPPTRALSDRPDAKQRAVRIDASARRHVGHAVAAFRDRPTRLDDDGHARAMRRLHVPGRQPVHRAGQPGQLRARSRGRSDRVGCARLGNAHLGGRRSAGRAARHDQGDERARGAGRRVSRAAKGPARDSYRRVTLLHRGGSTPRRTGTRAGAEA